MFLLCALPSLLHFSESAITSISILLLLTNHYTALILTNGEAGEFKTMTNDFLA